MECLMSDTIRWLYDELLVQGGRLCMLDGERTLLHNGLICSRDWVDYKWVSKPYQDFYGMLQDYGVFDDLCV
jgi:hypothetical protein